MADLLRLRFDADGDGTGQLHADVRLGGFSGEGAAWFRTEELSDFARALGDAYPLHPDAPVVLAGGLWSGPGLRLTQCHLGLTFFPVGRVGVVGCRVVLASLPSQPERPESRSEVAVELLTRYEPLRGFARALGRLVVGELDEATLLSELS